MTADHPAPPSRQPTVPEDLAALLGEREANLRQVILRAHRAMNRMITRRFAARGYGDVRPAHFTILANMDLGETRLADLVERAQTTPEAVSQLVSELATLGYLAQGETGQGVARFTDDGWELMLTSFNIQREIAADVGTRLQPGDLDQLRRILGLMAACE